MLLQSLRKAGRGGGFLRHLRVTVSSHFSQSRRVDARSLQLRRNRKCSSTHSRCDDCDARRRARARSFSTPRSAPLNYRLVSGGMTLTNIKPTKSPLPRYLNTFNAPLQQFLVLNLGGGSETICASHLFDGSYQCKYGPRAYAKSGVSMSNRLCLMIFY